MPSADQGKQATSEKRPVKIAVPLFGPWLRPMEDWKILLEGESLGLRQEIQLSLSYRPGPVEVENQNFSIPKY